MAVSPIKSSRKSYESVICRTPTQACCGAAKRLNRRWRSSGNACGLATTMMIAAQEVQSQVEAVYARERELGFLSLDALRSDCTFAVVEALAAGESPELLSYCPAWLLSELYAWLKAFHDQGHFGFISNLGEVDHSRLMAAVAAAVPSPTVFGPRANLRAQTTTHPTGRVHLHYTYYVHPTQGTPVLHGLHREYAEDGAIREIEYRDGEPLAGSRAFNPAGEPCDTQ